MCSVSRLQYDRQNQFADTLDTKYHCTNPRMSTQRGIASLLHFAHAICPCIAVVPSSALRRCCPWHGMARRHMPGTALTLFQYDTDDRRYIASGHICPRYILPTRPIATGQSPAVFLSYHRSGKTVCVSMDVSVVGGVQCQSVECNNR